MKNIFVTVAALTALFISGFAMAAGNVAAGKGKSATCAGCHGADGTSAVPNYPSLAGQHASYALKQLKNFKSGSRMNDIMKAQVQALSEQDMADLAAYYASLTAKVGNADKKIALVGEIFYRGGNAATGVAACIGCHGPSGKGNPGAGFPALTGQNSAYTESQLMAFRSGSRSNDTGKMMQGIAERMSDKEIKAVSAYASGLY